MNLFNKNKTLKPYVVVKDPYGCYAIVKLDSNESTTSKFWSDQIVKQHITRDKMYEKAEEIKQNYIEKHMKRARRRSEVKSSK